MGLQTITADILMQKNISAPKMIMPGILPVGLTIFAGRPKLGKSWWALNAAVSVASGSHFLGQEIDAGDALYLALEDTEQRLQGRLQLMLDGAAAPARLHLATSCPALDRGGARDISAWVKKASAPKVVIVDVLQKVRPEDKGARAYDNDYGAVTPLKRIADEYGVAVIAITHTRKADPGLDPLDAISATTGLAGAADHNLILDRGSDGLILYGRGRDVEEFKLALAHDGSTGKFNLLGDPEAVHRSGTRSRILSALPNNGDAIGPKEIAERAALPEANVKQALKRMLPKGEVTKRGRGAYARPITFVSNVTPHLPS